VLQNAQQVLGTLDTGTPKDLTTFYAAWNQLSTTPKDASARQAVLDAGKTIATDFNQAAQSLTDISNDAGLKMTSDVSTINSLSAQVAQLNQQIQAANASANTPNDLMDTRDKALDQLSSLAGVTLNNQADGTVDVFIGTQSLVRGGQSSNMALTATGGTYSLAMADPPNAPIAPGGELGGYMDVVNNAIPSLRSQMDSVANSLITTVNTAHQAGYDLNGNAGLPFFSGTTAGDISVNSALNTDLVAAAGQTGTPNDGNNALKIFGLGNVPVNSTGTVSDGLRALAAQFGSVAAAAGQTSSAASTALDGYAQYRASTDGVSVDSEMVEMIKYQRSYQAAAKIISTTDSMMDTLINGLGIGG
jgi:flagellar hook-associated protein 1